MDFRHEHKFIISRAHAKILENSLMGVMQKDSHLSGESYNIRSMYFDDYNHTCFYENENGTDPREKFRIRIYDSDACFIRLELKKKQNGMTQKQQCVMTKQQVDAVLCGKALDDFANLPALLKKFEIQRMTRFLKPDVIVDYDRVPFVYHMGNVRVTFDMNIATSTSFDAFFNPHMPKRPILQQDMMMLEVKYDEFLPEHIEEFIYPQTQQKTSFSKYYLCKKYSL